MAASSLAVVFVPALVAAFSWLSSLAALGPVSTLAHAEKNPATDVTKTNPAIVRLISTPFRLECDRSDPRLLVKWNDPRAASNRRAAL